jgi:hypothetical protein
MKKQHDHCLNCGEPTIPDPDLGEGTPYCPVCDAAWRQRTCVVCGEAYLVDVVRHRGGHHCDPDVELRIEARRKRGHTASRAQGNSLSARPKDGFRMMGYDR